VRFAVAYASSSWQLSTTSLSLGSRRVDARNACAREAWSNDVDLAHVKVDGTKARAPSTSGGADVELTIDPDLQKAVEKILAKSKAPAARS